MLSNDEKGITMEDRKRVAYLDLIKVIAIYLVCFYHFNNLDINIITNASFLTYMAYFFKGIASTCVPLFFVVNGALLLNGNYDTKKHIKKTITIIALTVIWGVITLFILAPIMGDHYTVKEFISALWHWKQGRINHLWFMTTIACIYLFFPLIKAAYQKDNKSALYYFLVVVFIFTFGNTLLNNAKDIGQWVLNINIIGSDINFFNKFNAFSGFYGYSLVYFILGGLLFAEIKDQKLKLSKPVIFAVFSAGTGALFVYGIIMCWSSKAAYDTVWNGYDTIMTLAMTIAIFVLVSKCAIKSRLIELISTNTLGIYFVHVIIGFAVDPYYKYLSFSGNFFVNLLYPASIMFVSLGIVIVLKKVPVLKLLFKI